MTLKTDAYFVVLNPLSEYARGKRNSKRVLEFLKFQERS